MLIAIVLLGIAALGIELWADKKLSELDLDGPASVKWLRYRKSLGIFCSCVGLGCCFIRWEVVYGSQEAVAWGFPFPWMFVDETGRGFHQALFLVVAVLGNVCLFRYLPSVVAFVELTYRAVV